jgi:hypothetical protein
MAQKLVFFFPNISAEILLPILRYNFCTEIHIWGSFWRNAVAIKSIKNIIRKAALLWH